jgi:transcriptional regulator with XRE-family HTH domain
VTTPLQKESSIYNDLHMENEIYGQYLREQRIRNKLSQLELASLLGLTPQAISRYESDKVKIPLDLVGRLCHILGLDIESFLFQKEGKHRTLVDEKEFSGLALANLLSDLRERQGLTLKEMGEKSGFSFQRIFKWEHRTSLPTLPEFIKIVDYFNLDYDYFYYGLEEARSEEPLEEIQPEPHEEEQPQKKRMWIPALASVGIGLVAISAALGLAFRNKGSNNSSVIAHDSTVNPSPSSEPTNSSVINPDSSYVPTPVTPSESISVLSMSLVDQYGNKVETVIEGETIYIKLAVSTTSLDSEIIKITDANGKNLEFTRQSDGTYWITFDKSITQISNILYYDGEKNVNKKIDKEIPAYEYIELGEGDKVVHIADATQFKSMNDANNIYVLDHDIDFSNETNWSPRPFKGTLIGNKHTIKGLHYTFTGSSASSFSLFSTATGKIQDISISDFVIDSLNFRYSSNISEEMNYPRISYLVNEVEKNLSLDNIHVLENNSINIDNSGTGLFAASSFVVAPKSGTDNRLEMSFCSNASSINIPGIAAGFVSLASNASKTDYINFVANDVLNTGNMVGKTSAAGIVSYSYHTVINRAINTGIIQAREAAGIDACHRDSEKTSVYQDCLNLGIIKASVNGAGIAEFLDSSSSDYQKVWNFEHCVSIEREYNTTDASKGFSGNFVKDADLTHSFYQDYLNLVNWNYNGYEHGDIRYPTLR